MNTIEMQIREFLKTLSLAEVYDSNLYGIDFDKASIYSIMQSINALYNDVESLGSIVNRNFEQKEGEHILLPKDRDTQNIVAQSYYNKQSALNKLLSNQYVSYAFNSYRKSQEEGSNLAM